MSAGTGLSSDSAALNIDKDIKLALGSCSYQRLLYSEHMLRVCKICLNALAVDCDGTISASQINTCNRSFSSTCS